MLGDKLSSIPRLSAEDFHSAVSENSQYDIIDTRPVRLDQWESSRMSILFLF